VDRGVVKGRVIPADGCPGPRLRPDGPRSQPV